MAPKLQPNDEPNKPETTTPPEATAVPPAQEGTGVSHAAPSGGTTPAS